MRNVFAKALALLPLAAAAMTYPPYEIYTGTTSGSPQLNYTKVCDPGRTGEASASYVTMGSLYPARPALVNTAYAGKVTIPAYIGGLPVRRINDAAFIVCQNITDVEIPATVREIGARAFSDCWNLTNITFAAGSCLATIGDGAFTNCISLATIKFPKTLSRLGAGCFQGCRCTVCRSSVPERTLYWLFQADQLWTRRSSRICKYSGAFLYPIHQRLRRFYSFRPEAGHF